MMRTLPGVVGVETRRVKEFRPKKKIIREEYRIHLFHSIPDVPNDLKLVGEREREEERLRE